MVVCVSQPASEVGLNILKAGGNAVDSAVAVALALTVTWPEAGNIGGGGFMVIHPGPGREPVVIDYREVAPAAATPGMFEKGVRSEYLLVAVPGTVRGLELAHKRFGQLSWKEVALPAVELARQGFAVGPALAGSLNRALAKPATSAEFRRVLGKDGGSVPWMAGDKLTQPDLARTLQAIAAGGADAFYSGDLARLLDQEMQQGGGLITTADLQNYRAKERQPIHGTFRGFDIYGPPPPSSGGICLVEMLNIVEKLDLRSTGRWSPRTAHLLIETMRRAYCDRARYLGDADFVKIPEHLTSKDYAATTSAQLPAAKATPSEALAPEIVSPEEGSSTTHFSVVDQQGMAVSNTYTLEQSYGSRIVVRGAGYLLNNEMGDFNPRPGTTNRAGLIGTPANVVAPGKRMLSSMTPVIVARDGRPVLLTGSPGGRTIINTVFCVLINTLEYDMPLRDAVDAPRFHHGWFPDRLRVEDALRAQHKSTLEQLERMGHKIDESAARQGDAHSISIDPAKRTVTGVADRRLDGWAAGY